MDLLCYMLSDHS